MFKSDLETDPANRRSLPPDFFVRALPPGFIWIPFPGHHLLGIGFFRL